MTFTLLPALDVAAGRAVAGVDTGDLRDVALAWQAAGATWIHLVDLDAAFGRGSNTELLAAVIGELDVEVQLSGGVCDDASLERALATGCARVTVSASALADPAWCTRVIDVHGERVAVSLDVRAVERSEGDRQFQLAARGGAAVSGELSETLDWLDRSCCARFVVTDVDSDGMLQGPNLELYTELAGATTAAVIASGGISSIADLVALAELCAPGAHLEGAVVGAALGAGRFTLSEALAAMQRVRVT